MHLPLNEALTEGLWQVGTWPELCFCSQLKGVAVPTKVLQSGLNWNNSF